MAIAKALGLKTWKIVFRKLVDSSFFKREISDPEGDFLDSEYWLDAGSRKNSSY